MTQFWTRDRSRMRLVAEDLVQFFVPHFGEGRVHHQDQPDGYGNRGGADLRRLRNGTMPGTS